MRRKISVENPNASAIRKENMAKKVKLMINPTITPRGLLLPPERDPESTIGKIGNMHGERIVTIPAKNAKRIRIIF